VKSFLFYEASIKTSSILILYSYIDQLSYPRGTTSSDSPMQKSIPEVRALFLCQGRGQGCPPRTTYSKHTKNLWDISNNLANNIGYIWYSTTGVMKFSNNLSPSNPGCWRLCEWGMCMTQDIGFSFCWNRWYNSIGSMWNLWCVLSSKQIHLLISQALPAFWFMVHSHPIYTWAVFKTPGSWWLVHGFWTKIPHPFPRLPRSPVSNTVGSNTADELSTPTFPPAKHAYEAWWMLISWWFHGAWRMS
jgi:hypothetical protein